MSLRLRLNLLIAGLMAIAWIAMIGALIVEVGPRASAESRSMMQIARQHIDRSMVVVRQSAMPRDALASLLNDLDHLRHVRIEWLHHNSESQLDVSSPKAASKTSAWKVRWLTQVRIEHLAVPVELRGGLSGEIRIAAFPQDEADEIASTVRAVALNGAVLCLAMLGLSSVLVSRSLAPIDSISETLEQLSCGHYSAQVTPSGSPELASICAAVNNLARALSAAQARNQQLTRDLVQVRDDERQELARELHDELGPYLFALRANGAALAKAADEATSEPSRLQPIVRGMLDHIDRIQSVNRRVLTQLSPPGLNELGLRASLQSMVEQWLQLREDLSIEVNIHEAADEIGDAEALTVYRIVQEAITNAVRHGKALRVRASVALERREGGQGQAIVVIVSDDGSGIRPGEHLGFGMRGMRDRVQALGGSVMTKTAVDGGTSLEARFPAEGSA